MSTTDITGELELRHLPTMHQLQLTKLLDVDDSVLSLLMGNIVKNLSDSTSQLRFNSADIDALREHSVRHGKSSIAVLLDEWSTMGKKMERPRVKNLLELLVKAQLFHAADYVAELINEARPLRPTSGPAARIDISLKNQDDIEEVVNNLNYPFSSINLTKINRINYEKPINTPDMNFVNESLNGNNQSTATVPGQPKQMSDLIKFSQSLSTQAPAVQNESVNSNSMAIPMTVNSSDNIPNEEVFIPALSGLMLSNNGGSQSRNIPAIVGHSTSSDQQSDVPDFSGLMGVESSEQSRYSTSMSMSSVDDSSRL